jgi:hypothetical protein
MSKKPKDRHLSGRMIRLPVEMHEALKQAAVKSRRAMTVELVIALEKHLRPLGLLPPK